VEAVGRKKLPTAFFFLKAVEEIPQTAFFISEKRRKKS
jgi:hypothetical protein